MIKEEALTLINQLAAKREELRKKKKFKEADLVKQELEKFGLTVEDTKDGVKLTFKSRVPTWIICWDQLAEEQLSSGYVNIYNIEYFTRKSITKVEGKYYKVDAALEEERIRKKIEEGK